MRTFPKPTLSALLFGELSFRQGEEIVALKGTVTGTVFNDRVFADPDVDGIETGAGDDIIVYQPPANGTAASIPYDPGPGADTVWFVDVEESTATVTEIDYVVRSTAEVEGDRIIVPGGSTHVFLSDTVLEIVEPDGDVRLINFVGPDGDSTEADLSGFFIQEEDVEDGVSEAFLVVAAADGPMPRPGTFLSETFLYNGNTEDVRGRGGDDVIAPSFASYTYGANGRLNIDGGFGNDVIFAAPSADGNFMGGPGHDRLFFNYDYFNNVPLAQEINLNLSLDGGVGNDVLNVTGFGAFDIQDGSIDLQLSGGVGADGVALFTEFGDVDPNTTLSAELDGGVGADEVGIWYRAFTGNDVDADLDVRGGFGDDTLFWRRDPDDTDDGIAGPRTIGTIDMRGGAGNDHIIVDWWGLHTGSMDIGGGAGEDVVEINYLAPDGASTSGAEDVNVDGGVNGSDLLIWKMQGPGNAVPPVVGSYHFNGGNGDDQFLLDLRGLGGGTFTVRDGEGSDTITLRYDENTAGIEECLIFEFGSGGLQDRSTTETVLLPDFNAQATEVSQQADGQYLFIDTSSLLVQTIGFEYDTGQALTPDELALLIGDDFLIIPNGRVTSDAEQPIEELGASTDESPYVLDVAPSADVLLS